MYQTSAYTQCLPQNSQSSFRTLNCHTAWKTVVHYAHQWEYRKLSVKTFRSVLGIKQDRSSRGSGPSIDHTTTTRLHRRMHFPIPGGPIRNLLFQNLPCNTTITFNIFFKSLSGISSSGNSSQLFSLIIDIRAGKAESSYKISNSTYILQLTSMCCRTDSIGGTHRFLDFFQYLFHPFTHLTR